MIKIYVNHYGWVMGWNPEKGFRFTPMKAGAKPLHGDKHDRRSEVYKICKYIELNMQCNYDIVRC